MLIKLAWKNIWRNKKRTIIVATSIFFAVFLASVMRSAQIGSFDYMIQSLANINMGYLQIQNPKYFDNRSLDNAIVINNAHVLNIRKTEHVTGASYRLESFGLLATDTLTEVGQIIGIDPENEHYITGLKNRLLKGSYLSDNDSGILIGEGLAKKLAVGLQDTLVFLGTGYHGHTAAALLVVQGILKFPIKELNDMMLFASLENAQHLFSMPQNATSIVINIDKLHNLSIVQSAIEKLKQENEALLNWEELMPEIKQLITMKYGSNYIMIGILYIVIGFGLFGVIMMMTMEREKEYGILNGIGMGKARILLVSFIESIFIAMIGIFSGIGITIPLAIYMANNPLALTGQAAASYEQIGVEPIITFSDNPDIFIYQATIVFIIAIVCNIYPLLFVTKLKIVDALKK